MKRAIDILGSSLGLIILVPLFLLVAILIKLSSRGPIFFRQERMGKDFRPFYIYKFRTMVADAPAMGPPITSADDHRIIVGLDHHYRTLFFITPMALLIFYLCNFYDSYRYRSFSYLVSRITLAIIALTILCANLSYLTLGRYMGRELLLTFSITLFSLLVLSRFLIIRVLCRIYQRDIGEFWGHNT